MADYAERFLKGQRLSLKTCSCIRKEKALWIGIETRADFARRQNIGQVFKLMHGSVIVKCCLYGIIFIEQPQTAPFSTAERPVHVRATHRCVFISQASFDKTATVSRSNTSAIRYRSHDTLPSAREWTLYKNLRRIVKDLQLKQLRFPILIERCEVVGTRGFCQCSWKR